MTQNSILLVGSSFGIYVPSAFIEHYKDQIINRRELREEIRVIENGHDDENYWEAFDDILSKAKLKVKGKIHLLHSDGDLWAIPEEEMELICQLD